MGQGDITVWVSWVREETEVIMQQLQEEQEARGDPDDPFNGTANGVFQPMWDNFALPPLVQMARRHENVSIHSKSSQKSKKSRQKTGTTGVNMKKTETKVQTQGEPHELSEPLLESLDQMRSM